MSGNYGYPQRNGPAVFIYYEADENGYRAKFSFPNLLNVGKKLPVPPELVESLLGG